MYQERGAFTVTRLKSHGNLVSPLSLRSVFIHDSYQASGSCVGFIFLVSKERGNKSISGSLGTLMQRWQASSTAAAQPGLPKPKHRSGKWNRGPFLWKLGQCYTHRLFDCPLEKSQCRSQMRMIPHYCKAFTTATHSNSTCCRRGFAVDAETTHSVHVKQKITSQLGPMRWLSE